MRDVYGTGPDKKGPHDWTSDGAQSVFEAEAQAQPLGLYSFPMRKAMTKGAKNKGDGNPPPIRKKKENIN